MVKARMGDNVFKPHDRVVVLKGRDKGKIGTIQEINEDERMSATIEGINKVCRFIKIPSNSANNCGRSPSMSQSTCAATSPINVPSVSFAVTFALMRSD